MFQVLCNLTKHRGGLEAALAASLVENLIGLLKEGKPVEVQREASVTLAIACFDDMAKIVAIQVRHFVLHCVLSLPSSSGQVWI